MTPSATSYSLDIGAKVFPLFDHLYPISGVPSMSPPLLCGGGIYDGSLQIVSTAGSSAPCAASPAAFSWCPRRLCLSPPGPPRPSCGLSPNFCACGGSTISLTPGGIFLCPNFYACGRYTISLTPGGVFLCISWRSAVLLPCPRTLCSYQQVICLPPQLPPFPCFFSRLPPVSPLVHIRLLPPPLCPCYSPLIFSPFYLPPADSCIRPRHAATHPSSPIPGCQYFP